MYFVLGSCGGELKYRCTAIIFSLLYTCMNFSVTAPSIKPGAAEQGGKGAWAVAPPKLWMGGPRPPNSLGSNWEAYTEPCVIRTVAHLSCIIKAATASVKNSDPFILSLRPLNT